MSLFYQVLVLVFRNDALVSTHLQNDDVIMCRSVDRLLKKNQKPYVCGASPQYRSVARRMRERGDRENHVVDGRPRSMHTGG